jgi:hypothetical protein
MDFSFEVATIGQRDRIAGRVKLAGVCEVPVVALLGLEHAEGIQHAGNHGWC